MSSSNSNYNSYEKQLAHMTREELIDKIQNQRTEIRHLRDAHKQAINSLSVSRMTIRAAIKLMRPLHVHTAAYSLLTNTCADGTAVLREIAKYG